jgi:hypothetical protein
MKASDFNKTTGQPQLQNQQRRPSSFTGEHLVKIVKSLVGLVILYLFITFGKWGIEFAVQHKLLPPTQAQVDSAVIKIVKAKSDTIKIPMEVQYNYEASFKPTKDTTYWFFTGNLTGPNNYYQGNSRTIKMPYPFFNFYEAAEFLKKGNPKAKDAYIESFIQISKASYLSYKKYANAN